MKRYIKASFNNDSIPNWLKQDKQALEALNAHGIDLANCEFSKERKGKVGENYTAYLVKGTNEYDSYAPFVWIPGLYNDDHYVDFKDWDKRGWDSSSNQYRYGARNSRAIKYFPKKDLNFIDTIYVNIASNAKPAKEHYKDPRKDDKGNYAGQYLIPDKKRYNYDTKEDELVTPAHWSEAGKTTYSPGRYGKAQMRDKSGYIIPNPKDRLAAFHETEEGRSRRGALAQRKIQQVYDDLVALRDSILGDLNSKTVETFGSNYRALDYFNDAVRYYKDALDNLKDKGWGPDPEDALTNIDYANSRIKSANDIISGKKSW